MREQKFNSVLTWAGWLCLWVLAGYVLGLVWIYVLGVTSVFLAMGLTIVAVVAFQCTPQYRKLRSFWFRGA